MAVLSYLLRNHLNEALGPAQAGAQVDFEEKMADQSRYTIGHNIHAAKDNPDGEGMDDGTGSPYDGAQVPDPSGAPPPAAPPDDQELQNVEPGGPGGGPPQQPMEAIEMNEYENKLVDLFLEELFSEGEPTKLTERGPYNEPYNKPTVDYYDRTGIAAGQPGIPQHFGDPAPAGPPAPQAAAPQFAPAASNGGARQAAPRAAAPRAGAAAPAKVGNYGTADSGTGGLQQGTTGTRNRDMQTYLNNYNGPKAPQLDVDSKWGPKSAAALGDFQNRTRNQGGSPDRVADRNPGAPGGNTGTGPGWGTAAALGGAAAGGAAAGAGMAARGMRPAAPTPTGSPTGSFNDRVEQRLDSTGRTGANRPAWAGAGPETPGAPPISPGRTSATPRGAGVGSALAGASAGYNRYKDTGSLTQAATTGLGTAGAAMQGAKLGARIPGPWPVKAGGALIGGGIGAVAGEKGLNAAQDYISPPTPKFQGPNAVSDQTAASRHAAAPTPAAPTTPPPASTPTPAPTPAAASTPAVVAQHTPAFSAPSREAGVIEAMSWKDYNMLYESDRSKEKKARGY